MKAFNYRHLFQKICLLFINVFITFYLSKAQHVFNKAFFENRPAMVFSSVMVYDTTYLISGLAIDTATPNYANAMLINLTDTGRMVYLKETKNVKEYGIFLNNLIKTKSGGFAFTGYVIDTVATLAFALFYPDNDSLVVLNYNTIDTYVYLGNALLQATDSFFYVAGIKTNNSTGNGNICLVKIETSGNKIWENFYDQYKLDDARSIIQLSNGNLLLGAVRNDLNHTQEHANTWLLEVDKGGTMQRQWFDPNDSTYAAYGLLQTSDGGFIYGAQKKSYQSVNDVYKTATIVKLDSNFNKEWVFNSDTICPEGFTDIEILSDGSYIACGSKNYRYAWIVKLSTTGQKLWSREYVGIPDWGSTSYLEDIDVLPDGGFIAVGQSQKSGATPPQVGWFLKLDSNGCEIENCTVGITEIKTEKPQINIYPNPASGSVQLQLQNEMLGGDLKVYDIQGRLVKQLNVLSLQFTVDVGDLSKGLYVVVVEKQLKQARGKLVVE